jgi:hypothetical protein
MDAHLLERHPNWELTLAKEKRDAFLSQMCISESEETHLGIIKSTATPQRPNTPVHDGARGQKRVPNSPAGAPRRPRRLRMSHTDVLEPQTSHSTQLHSVDDVFLE